MDWDTVMLRIETEIRWIEDRVRRGYDLHGYSLRRHIDELTDRLKKWNIPNDMFLKAVQLLRMWEANWLRDIHGVVDKKD